MTKSGMLVTNPGKNLTWFVSHMVFGVSSVQFNFYLIKWVTGVKSSEISFHTLLH